MITIELSPHSPYVKERGKKPKFVSGSTDHRQFILDRALTELAEESLGDVVFVKGKGAGTIIYIASDLSLVEWDGLKVKYIEVWFPETEETALFHHSDLKRKKR